MKKTHRSIFLKQVKEAFPELVAKINSEYGLLHLEMHAFLEFVQKQIERKNTERDLRYAQRCPGYKAAKIFERLATALGAVVIAVE